MPSASRNGLGSIANRASGVRSTPVSVYGPTGLSGVALAGCGGAGAPLTGTGPALGDTYTGPPITISYWNGSTGGNGLAMRKLVADFNASQDRITVEQDTVRRAHCYQRVIAAVHAGKGPDV